MPRWTCSCSVAGCRATTQRRVVDEPRRARTSPNGPVTINEVFAAHPEWVLGELGVGRGRYRDDDLIVRARTALVDGREVREPLGPAMNAALTRIIDSAVASGLGITERISAPGANVDAAEVDWVADVTIGPHHVEGSLLVRDQAGSPASRAGFRSRIHPRPRRLASWAA